MLVIIGHSGSGKDTIAREVSKALKLNNIVSYTTRPMRNGEVDGVNYHFISKNEFEKKLGEGFFAEHTNYRDWYYACAVEDCKDDSIIVVEPFGLRQLKKNPNVKVISFFIEVEERIRLRRLCERGDDITELCRRIISDRDTFRGVAELEVDFVVENNEEVITAINKVAHFYNMTMYYNQRNKGEKNV